MDYFKKFEGCYKYDDECGFWCIDEGARDLSNDDFTELLSYINELNTNILERLNSRIKNVSTADVILAKNFNRKFDKSNVCIRVSKNLIDDYRKFAGELDVPVQDLMVYVLEFGFKNYRAIKEI